MTTVKSMKLTKRFLTLALLANLALGPGLAGGIAQAAMSGGKGKNTSSSKGAKHNKIAADLRDQLGNQSGADRVKVILQLDGKPSGQLNALLASNGVKIRKQFTSLDSFALELPLNVVNVLSQFSEVAFISIDSEVMTLGGHVAHTTGADNVRSMSSDGALDGSGIGIAILDSGIFGGHTSFLDSQTGEFKDLPRYPRATRTYAQIGPINGTDAGMFMLETAASYDRIAEFYEQAIKKNGWTVVNKTKDNEYYKWELMKGKTSEALIEVKSDGKSSRKSILLSRAERPPGK